MPKYDPNAKGSEGLDRTQRLEKHAADSPTLSPAASTDNVVQPSADGVVAFVVKRPSSVSTADLIQFQDETGARLGGVDYTGATSGYVPASKLDSLEPFVIGHRGASYVYPENTVLGYLRTLGDGIKVIKAGDYWKTLDGQLASMHDQTLDRTTNGTGNVSAQTAASLAAISVDPSTWFAANWPNMPVPMIGDVLSALQGKAITFLDAKSAGSGALIVSALQRWNLTKNAVVISFTPSELAAAQAAGIITGYEDATATPNLANAVGCKYVILDYTQVSDATITSTIAAGYKVLLYTPNTRTLRDHYTALGVSGFFSDDPAWLAETAPTLTSDPFATQTYYPGVHADNGTTSRGVFLGTNRWGFAVNGTCWASAGFLDLGATPPTTWHLTVTITFDALSADGSRHPGIGFCVDKDDWVEGGSLTANVGQGYHVFITQAGDMKLFDITTTATQLGSTTPTAAITAGNSATIKIDVTPTTVTVTRTDSGGFTPISVANTAHRGRYFHLGKNDSGAGGLHVSFSAVTRT